MARPRHGSTASAPRTAPNEIWITSQHSVLEMLRGHHRLSKIMLNAKRVRDLENIKNLADQKNIPVHLLQHGAFEQLLSRLAVHPDAVHQGVIASLEEYTYCRVDDWLKQSAFPSVIIALDQITDPHNLGAIIRTGVALGAPYFVLTQDRSALINSTVVRASAGAVAHANIALEVNLVRALNQMKAVNCCVIGLDGAAPTSLKNALKGEHRPIVIVVGSEGTGLRRLVREACDVLASIPMNGPIQSLNASVASALAVHTVIESIKVRA